MKTRIPFLLLMILVLCACGDRGDSPVAGGFGSETTNGIHVVGNSVRGVDITARKVGGGAKDVLTRTDSNGFWELTLTPGAWSIIGRTETGEAFAQAVSLAPTDKQVDAGWADPQKLGKLYGFITDGCPDDTVTILGLGLKHGGWGFEFDSIPQGTYLVQLSKLGVVLETRLVETGSEIQFSIANPTILLGDFDDSTHLFPLSTVLQGNWETWVADSLTDELGQVLSKDIAAFVNVPLPWGGQGRSLHAVVRPRVGAKPQDRKPFIFVFGARRGQPSSHPAYDLSFSDSLVFQARGHGEVFVTVWMSADSTGSGGINFLEKRFDLDSAWTRKGYSWKDFLDTDTAAARILKGPRVVKIAWSVHDADFWLDDVRITPGRAELLVGGLLP